MKKIGLVSEYFYPHLGGITEHVYYYAKELIARGFDVTILTGYAGEAAPDFLPPALKIIRMGRSVPIFSNASFAKVTLAWNLGEKIKRVIKAEQFDLIHIHAPAVPVLPALFQKYADTVTIGTFHTYFDWSFYYALLKKTMQPYLDHLDGMVAVSPPCLDALQRYFRIPAGHRIIPNGIDIEWFATPSGKHGSDDDGVPTILFLGRLDPRNGLDLLLAAFPQVLKTIPQARLLVVGDGPLRLMYERKAGALLNQSIFFEGQVNEGRPDYFAKSDVFCYPAMKASFGITLLEAMAAGTPIVATDNVGFRYLVRHGHNGMLVEAGNAPALAATLTQVLCDKALASTLRENGRHEVKAFAWSRVTDQLLAYYNDVFLEKKGVPFAAC